MLRTIVVAVILIPLAIVIIGFAVANRQAVTISFDPFDASQPAYSTTLPLFVVIFLLVIFGVLVGGIAAWLRQSKWRSAARRAETQNRELTAEVTMLRRRLDPAERSDLPARMEPAPPLSLRSPTG
ncbi:MAG: DUF1049 domain-containing protein [Rhizobiales bacterium]|nr:DUF1049 domain-containing protein [Hyphomicrobiales bacterium]